MSRFLLLHLSLSFCPCANQIPRPLLISSAPEGTKTPNLLLHQPTYPFPHTPWVTLPLWHVPLPIPPASPPHRKRRGGHFPFFFFSQRFAFVDSKWKLYSLFMTQLGFLTSLLVWDNRSIQRVIKKIKFRRVVKERGS